MGFKKLKFMEYMAFAPSCLTEWYSTVTLIWFFIKYLEQCNPSSLLLHLGTLLLSCSPILPGCCIYLTVSSSPFKPLLGLCRVTHEYTVCIGAACLTPILPTACLPHLPYPQPAYLIYLIYSLSTSSTLLTRIQPICTSCLHHPYSTLPTSCLPHIYLTHFLPASYM